MIKKLLPNGIDVNYVRVWYRDKLPKNEVKVEAPKFLITSTKAKIAVQK